MKLFKEPIVYTIVTDEATRDMVVKFIEEDVKVKNINLTSARKYTIISFETKMERATINLGLMNKFMTDYEMNINDFVTFVTKKEEA